MCNNVFRSWWSRLQTKGDIQLETTTDNLEMCQHCGEITLGDTDVVFAQEGITFPIHSCTKKNQLETTTNNLFDEITIDYSGFHGVVVSALVTDAATPFSWIENLQLIGHNECESDWHDDNCDCPTDDYYKQVFVNSMSERGIAIITDNKDGE